MYEPANLLILQDNARNMKRTMDLLALFDSDTFAGQRVRLFEIENSRPSDLVKELESVFKAYSLTDKERRNREVPSRRPHQHHHRGLAQSADLRGRPEVDRRSWTCR